MREAMRIAGKRRLRIAILVAILVTVCRSVLVAQALQTAGQVVVHSNAAVNLGSTAWTEMPGAKGAVTLPVGGDLAIVFTAEVVLTGGSNATMYVRAVVDGNVAEQLGLGGKPEPDTLLEAARRVEVAPAQVVAVEDAIVGVEAGRLAGVGYVVGVARPGGDRARLESHGADVVVEDLAELVPPGD